jgi:hypothetical protein
MATAPLDILGRDINRYRDVDFQLLVRQSGLLWLLLLEWLGCYSGETWEKKYRRKFGHMSRLILMPCAPGFFKG